MSELPDVALVRTLAAPFQQAVSEDFVDENGHMNIGDYFRLGTWAPWLRMAEVATGDDYIQRRQSSFFTVEHHIGYLHELRLGERFSVHAGFAGRTAKALHAVGIVVDDERDRIACLLEVMYVHVSMETRRAADIPDDVAAALDAEIAEHPWLADAATGLSLRR